MSITEYMELCELWNTHKYTVTLDAIINLTIRAIRDKDNDILNLFFKLKSPRFITNCIESLCINNKLDDLTYFIDIIMTNYSHIITRDMIHRQIRIAIKHDNADIVNFFLDKFCFCTENDKAMFFQFACKNISINVINTQFDNLCMRFLTMSEDPDKNKKNLTWLLDAIFSIAVKNDSIFLVEFILGRYPEYNFNPSVVFNFVISMKKFEVFNFLFINRRFSTEEMEKCYQRVCINNNPETIYFFVGLNDEFIQYARANINKLCKSNITCTLIELLLDDPTIYDSIELANIDPYTRKILRLFKSDITQELFEVVCKNDDIVSVIFMYRLNTTLDIKKVMYIAYINNKKELIKILYKLDENLHIYREELDTVWAMILNTIDESNNFMDKYKVCLFTQFYSEASQYQFNELCRRKVETSIYRIKILLKQNTNINIKTGYLIAYHNNHNNIMTYLAQLIPFFDHTNIISNDGELRRYTLEYYKTEHTDIVISTSAALSTNVKDDICPICIINTYDSKTVCGHQYCYHCVNTWWETKNTCPICREQLDFVISLDA